MVKILEYYRLVTSNERLTLRTTLRLFSESAYGGTGQTTDWSLAAEVANATTILLAGGLTPDNVQEAITQVHPYGVDVSSGVEASPGKKDHEKIRAFIHAAQLVS